MANSSSRSGCWYAVLAIGALLFGAVAIAGVWVGDVLMVRNSEAYRRSTGAVLADPYVKALVGAPQVGEWWPHGELVETTGGGTATFDVTAVGADGQLVVRVTSFRRGDAWEIARLEGEGEDGWVPLAELAAAKGVTVGGEAAEVMASAAGSGTGRARQLVAEARAAYDANRDQEALAGLDLAIELEETLSEAWHWRGRVKVRLGDNVGATMDLSRAVELDPQNAAAWEGLAWVRARSNQDFEAIVALTRYLELKPGDAKALNDRANAYFRTSTLDKAKADAQAACDTGYEAGCQTLARLRSR